jgi:hypothetical protein
LQGLTSWLETATQNTLNGLVAEERSDGLLVSRSIYVGKVVGAWQSESKNSDPALAIASSMEDGSLQTDHRLGHGLVDGHLDDVCLVARESREGA